MTEVSRNLRYIFFPKIPPILNLKLDFFPVKKSFSQIFQNTANFFYLNFISKKKKKKSEKLFREGGREGGRELMTTRFARLLSGEGRRS